MAQLIQIATELYSKMQADLQSIRQQPQALLVRSQMGYNRCVEALGQLKAYISAYKFSSEQEEITFFKETKPGFLREMFLHQKLVEIESGRPIKTIEELIDYYTDQIRHIGSYIEHNRVLYLYYRMGWQHLDSKMFVRNPEGLFFIQDYQLEGDASFSNVYSLKLAKLQAAEELVDLLQNMVLSLRNGDTTTTGTPKGPTPLVWTGQNAQFYEWVLGAVKTGVFGDVSIKQAMEYLAYCLRLSIGHYYRSFYAMRIRKKTRTPYLHACIEAAEKYMDELDENPKF